MSDGRGNRRAHGYTAIWSYHSVPWLWRFKTNNGGRKPIFATTARLAKCRDKEAKLPKTQKEDTSTRRRWLLHRRHGRSRYYSDREKKTTRIGNTWFPDRRQICTRYTECFHQIESNSVRLIKNIIFCKVSFICAHGLETTKETRTGPATIIYDTYCYYCCTFGVRLVSVKLKVEDTECPLQVCQLSRSSESTHFRSFVEM